MTISGFTHERLFLTFYSIEGFTSASAVKNLPEMQEVQETQILSLGQEDPLEKGIAAHSSILAWRIPWTEDLADHSP